MQKRVLLFVFMAFVGFGCRDKAGDLSGVPYNPTPYNLPQPAQFPTMEIPADNPLTVEGVELGRYLFYDKLLSSDGRMSCASCHLPSGSFTDNKAVSTGVQGLAGSRSSMSLLNIGFVTKGLFWDGRVKTLEEQALLPIEDPIELHSNWNSVVEKLKKHPDYPIRFRKAFGIENTASITKEWAVKAIAQFERSLVSANAKVDKVFRREAFFTDDELEGFQMFFDAGGTIDAQCGHCHNSPFYASSDYFNNGLDSANTLTDFRDKGRGLVTGRAIDNGKFRAPTLRNIELTAPYMHDGRFQTLEQVMEHYASGGHYAENRDPFLPQIKQVNMTARQKRQIIAFMKTLTDTSFVNNPAFKSPF